jgi:hypothetical protein
LTWQQRKWILFLAFERLSWLPTESMQIS